MAAVHHLNRQGAATQQIVGELSRNRSIQLFLTKQLAAEPMNRRGGITITAEKNEKDAEAEEKLSKSTLKTHG
jgi:hypothetical protein